VDLAEHRRSDDQSPFSGEATGPNPTDRGKSGTKRSVLTEGKGIPIAIVVAGANRNDMKLLADTLQAVVIERPEPTETDPQHLCADKGYDFAVCRAQAEAQGYVPHIRARGEERQAKREHPDSHPRRWVVEVCHSWLNRFRKILVRFEKLEATHLALLQFACAYVAFRRAVSC
jgi:putative transposase